MSSATPGSKANWGCASFTCAAWPKCKWKCSGPPSPTTCNDGSDSANCKPQPPNKQRDREIQKLLAQKTNHVSATASPNLALSPARLFKDGFFTASKSARHGAPEGVWTENKLSGRGSRRDFKRLLDQRVSRRTDDPRIVIQHNFYWNIGEQSTHAAFIQK